MKHGTNEISMDPRQLEKVSNKQTYERHLKSMTANKRLTLFDASSMLYKSQHLQTMLRDLLPELPDQERKVVHLRFWQNYDFEEIAKALRMKRQKVDEVLENALILLRKLFIAALSEQEMSAEEPMLTAV